MANDDATTVHEVTFAGGTCLIELEENAGLTGASFVARLSWVDSADEAVRPLVFSGGERVVVKGSTEAAALRAATGYLETHFGALCEPEHGHPIATRRQGLPLVTEHEPNVADEAVEEALEGSFPASDPPSFTPETGATIDKGRS